MNELHLFAGIGGGIYGGILCGHRCVCAVEIQNHHRSVLLQRQRDGIFPWFPVWDDAETFRGRPWRGIADAICAGFPCQPFSVEGKRNWDNDERNKWPSTRRIISEVMPKHVMLENVRGIKQFLPVVIRDLRQLGYTVERPAIISSGSAGALHRRERIWVYAHANGSRRFWERDTFDTPAWAWVQTWSEFEGLAKDVLRVCVPARNNNGIHDGIANRRERGNAIGNAQDPRVAALAWQILAGEE